MGRPSYWLKIEVRERDGGKCRYCGARATTVDHVVPRSKGGADTPDNLVAACLECNRRKADRMPDDIQREGR